ncbi:MAG: lytic transglycosylase domain-containing protein, partial [Bryobacteraceae bacterium]
FTPGRIAGKRIARARLLTLACLNDFASGELQFGAHEDDDQRNVYAYELAKMAAAQDQPARAMNYIATYTPRYLYMPLDEAPIAFWRLAFPLPYRASIERHSRQERLDPFLVAALIRQESEFNAHVISYAHAYGLMQILPSTGRRLARHFRVRRFRARELLLPDRNVQFGTYFFRNLLDAYNGDVELALAAYNAGPSRAKLWRTWGPYSEPAEFIETVPFHQTRGYIQLVLRNANVYRRLYAKAVPEVPAYRPKPAPKPRRLHKTRRRHR